MMAKLVVLGTCLALVSAAAMDHQRPGRFAEERDGAHHGSGSSYAAPAAPAPAPSYSAPAPEHKDQGNMYYYYYPVDESGHDLAGSGFDVFTSIILPLVILGGLLLALSSLTFTFTGRAMREGQEPGLVEQLHSEVERIFNIYMSAMESEECVQRALCQSGSYAKTFKHKNVIMSVAQAFVPEHMKGNMDIFKAAAKDGFEMKKCHKYKCKAPKIFN